MRALFLVASVAVATVIALTGCSTILGIQPFVTERVDASTGLEGSTSPIDAATGSPGDATGTDAEPDDTADAMDAGGGGGDDGGPVGPPCTAGGTCNAGPCQNGQWSCVDAGAVCVAIGSAEAGTFCSPPADAGSPAAASGDGGATYVCHESMCNECPAGQDCSTPDAGSCQRKSIDCSSGTGQCTVGGTLPEGESCGGMNYCYGGVCSACQKNAPCSPSGAGSNPCHQGTTSCTNGIATCVEQNAPAAAGAACATSTGASGVCDGNSTCVACSQGGSCSPAGNPCKSGTMSCSGGYSCVAGNAINEGQTCGSGQICSGGSCVACNATSCSNGCCGSAGCLPTSGGQSTSACGNSGATCGACAAPANGVATCNGVCGIQCNTNYIAYQGACVACTQSAACSPDACQTGTMSCVNGSAPTCTPTASINNGKPCGSGEICSGGSCVGCNGTSCPSGCCDSNGCVTSQSPSECGTGTGGGTCRTCPAPTGSGSATCSGDNCGISCASGFHACGATTCASNTSPSTCGTACTPCSAANVATSGCSGGACTVATCSPNYADCDSSFSNGCETNLETSNANCGTCGMACPTSQGCLNGTCVPQSCAGGGPGLSNCGTSGTESCCTSLQVVGGTFDRTYRNTGSGPTNEADPATISTFDMDKYKVTVGRFRQFVTAWNGGNGFTPNLGSGRHSYLNGGEGLNATGGGYEPGWQVSDNANIDPTASKLSACYPYSTWTSTPGSNENLPIECLDWYTAYAFCIWDGGFLPSQAEWLYAAAGGSQQREYPWGSTAPGTTNQYAIYGCLYPSGSGTCTGTTNIAPVGTPVAGAGLWGQLDLAGEMSEWNLDWYTSSGFVDPCTDCAYLTPGTNRILMGSFYMSMPIYLMTEDSPSNGPPNETGEGVGLRCARGP